MSSRRPRSWSSSPPPTARPCWPMSPASRWAARAVRCRAAARWNSAPMTSTRTSSSKTTGGSSPSRAARRSASCWPVRGGPSTPARPSNGACSPPVTSGSPPNTCSTATPTATSGYSATGPGSCTHRAVWCSRLRSPTPSGVSPAWTSRSPTGSRHRPEPWPSRPSRCGRV